MSDDTTKGSKPDYICRAKRAEDSEFMNTIGAAWNFKNGDGVVVRLEMLPTDWDGSFILVPPKEE